MQTAKKLGFVKGDMVLTEAGFPAILISDINTATPCAEVWGIEHEMGSCYAENLRRVGTFETFQQIAQQYGHVEINAYSEVARKAIKEKQQLVLL